MLKKRLHAIWNPSLYHGWGRKRRFFEGWYYKVVSADQQHAYAFIPGIAMDKLGEKQAFIQVLDGKNLTAEYFKFQSDDFFPRAEDHDVLVGESRFTEQKIELDLPGIKGTLYFNNLNSWPNSWYSPGIMGPFSFVPFMQCYHGILSMDHEINGQLTIDDRNINFDGGRGYIEKDWGHSFPEGYIWMQCNHFTKPGVSVKVSIAKIPWLGSSFTGFIAGILFSGKLYQFTTYHFAKLRQCVISGTSIHIKMESPKYTLEVEVKRVKGTTLVAPIVGFMDARIEESMNSTMQLSLTNKRTGQVILSEQGTSVAVEVAGKYEQLLTQ